MAAEKHFPGDKACVQAARSGIALVARACDLKQSDSPSPSNIAPSQPKCRRLLPVLSRTGGKLLYYVDDAQARDLLASGEAEILTTKKGRTRALRLITVVPGRLPKPRKYSHNRETKFGNVRGCWTLIHIPTEDRAIYRAVLDGCLAA